MLLQNATDVYYKMRQLLQNATFVTNCESQGLDTNTIFNIKERNRIPYNDIISRLTNSNTKLNYGHYLRHCLDKYFDKLITLRQSIN